MQGLHFRWLDWCRFFAAFLVLAVHCRGASFVEYGALPPDQHTVSVAIFFAVTRLGKEAVIVFFVLSGFLVGGKLIERAWAGIFDVRLYAADRLSRLYVPLLPALLWTALVGYVIGSPVGTLDLLGSLFSLQGILVSSPQLNGPLWSLAYEFWFYALAGVSAMALTKRSPTIFVCVAAILSIFTVLRANLLICWLIGSLAYVCRPAKRSYRAFAIGCFTTLVGIACTQMASASVSFPSVSQAPVPNEATATVLLAFGIGLVVQQLVLMPASGRLMISFDKLGSVLADRSYTLYLTHYPTVMALTAFGLRRSPEISTASLLLFAMRMTICLGVAYLLHLAFERHTGRVRRWIKRLDRSSAKRIPGSRHPSVVKTPPVESQASGADP